MHIAIKIARTSAELNNWDNYVHSHPESNLYQLSGWKNVIEGTYGHDTYYLVATSTQSLVIGILPLVHMKHFIFGNRLVSIPFFDMAGILADSVNVEQALVNKAIRLGKELSVNDIELRHDRPHSWLQGQSKDPSAQRFDESNRTDETNQTNKVLMILDLPGSSQELLQSFKSKLRSQIKLPMKEGLTAKIGGLDLIEDFYAVFCVNMRDLGSPVHSRKLIHRVLDEFPDKARIVIIYKAHTPVACSLVIGHQDTLENPWASSLREFSHLAPNMLMYWTMLEYACDNGFRKFDFGRSTPGEGTFNFKKQWGAEPQALHWLTLNGNGQPVTHSGNAEKDKFSKAIEYWQKLPVSVTQTLGPLIRKHISL